MLMSASSTVGVDDVTEMHYIKVPRGRQCCEPTDDADESGHYHHITLLVLAIMKSFWL